MDISNELEGLNRILELFEKNGANDEQYVLVKIGLLRKMMDALEEVENDKKASGQKQKSYRGFEEKRTEGDTERQEEREIGDK